MSINDKIQIMKNEANYLILIAVVVIGVGFWFSGFRGDKTAENKDMNLEEEVEMVSAEGGPSSGWDEQEFSNNETEFSPTPTPTPVFIDEDRFISFLHLAREQFNDDQLAESKDSYQKAIANGSNTKLLVANAWFELYYVLIALDDIEAARVALDTAIEMDPDNDTFLNAKEAFERRTK